MVYKCKQNWKDLVEKADHRGLTRRELLAKGLATSVLTAVLPESWWGAKAFAAPNCPTPVRSPGAIGHIYAEGGPTMGARFIGEDQAAIMNATVAANYGISGTNLLKLGPNLVIDTTSPFGATLMQGPSGFPGGAAAWQGTVLNKISGGGHRGPFNSDDGAGADTGLIGGVSPFKISQMGRDVRVNVSRKMALWAGGLPSTSISRGSLTTANMAKLFSVVPAASGLTTAQSMTNASRAAIDLAQALSGTIGGATRNGAQTLVDSAGCALAANATLADPNFGNALFNVSGIAALTSVVGVGTLSAAEQALIGAYYQSATGTIGGVSYQLNGRDYHGQDPANVIAPADIEEARAIVMFLTACHAAQAPGAFVYFSNGQAIASGVQAVTATIGGTQVTVNAPVARGDAGGSYNAGLVIFYDPLGAPPAAKMTGTITSGSGNAKADSAVGSSANAVAGLYLSALKWINGGNVPAAALTAMNISNPSSVMVV